MRVLSLDTATDCATAALGVDGLTVATAARSAPGSAAREVLALVDEVLTAGGVQIGDLDGIVVGTGPGSFTGLRIGIATATALADACGLPLTGVSTLAALCETAPAGSVAVIDARRREVFAAGPGVAAAAYDPAALAALLAPRTALVGDGAVRYRAVFETAGHPVAGDDDPAHLVAASAHLRLARFDGAAVVPTYLREPDAVPAGGPS
jgi:tRNA threonylcarbamoyladenosine biosynthesis protein TsaB